MIGIWISAATIARFAVAGSLMTLMAGGRSAPKAGSTIVEQTSYFALPGKAEDVYPCKTSRLRCSRKTRSPARPCSSPPGKLGHASRRDVPDGISGRSRAPAESEDQT
jgi:hypothetical protein